MNFKSEGRGKFTLYADCEHVTAEYTRGVKIDGTFKPHWTLKHYGKLVTIYGDKNDAILAAEKLLTEQLNSPLNATETLAMQRRDGCIHGVIAIPLIRILGTDPDQFKAQLAAHLSEQQLENVTYRARDIDNCGSTILISVTGSYRDIPI